MPIGTLEHKDRTGYTVALAVQTSSFSLFLIHIKLFSTFVQILQLYSFLLNVIILSFSIFLYFIIQNLVLLWFVHLVCLFLERFEFLYKKSPWSVMITNSQQAGCGYRGVIDCVYSTVYALQYLKYEAYRSFNLG